MTASNTPALTGATATERGLLRPRPAPPVTVCVEYQVSVRSPGELHVVAQTPEGVYPTTARVLTIAISSSPGDHGGSSIQGAP